MFYLKNDWSDIWLLHAKNFLERFYMGGFVKNVWYFGSNIEKKSFVFKMNLINY